MSVYNTDEEPYKSIAESVERSDQPDRDATVDYFMADVYSAVADGERALLTRSEMADALRRIADDLDGGDGQYITVDSGIINASDTAQAASIEHDDRGAVGDSAAAEDDASR
jgi:hypothetical protein